MDAKCRVCHTEPPQNGAPFSLEGYESLHAPISSEHELRYQRMHQVIESGFMPPAWASDVGALTEEERSTLLTWLAADAPRGTGTCE